MNFKNVLILLTIIVLLLVVITIMLLVENFQSIDNNNQFQGDDRQNYSESDINFDNQNFVSKSYENTVDNNSENFQNNDRTAQSANKSDQIVFNNTVVSIEGNKILNAKEILENTFIGHPDKDINLPIIDGEATLYLMGPCKGCSEEEQNRSLSCVVNQCPLDSNGLIEQGYYSAGLVLDENNVYSIPLTRSNYEYGIMAVFKKYGIGKRIDNVLYTFGIKADGSISRVSRWELPEKFYAADSQNARYFQTIDPNTQQIKQQFLDHGI